MKALQRTLVIEFYNGAFCMKEKLPELMRDNYWDLRTNSNFSLSSDLVVIGNIYENPELIPNTDFDTTLFDVSRE